jgi:hypothetical protein
MPTMRPPMTTTRASVTAVARRHRQSPPWARWCAAGSSPLARVDVRRDVPTSGADRVRHRHRSTATADQDRQRSLLWLQGAVGRRCPIPQPQQHSGGQTMQQQMSQPGTARAVPSTGPSCSCGGHCRRQEPSHRANDDGRRLRHGQDLERRTHWYLNTPAPAVGWSTRRSA